MELIIAINLLTCIYILIKLWKFLKKVYNSLRSFFFPHKLSTPVNDAMYDARLYN